MKLGFSQAKGLWHYKYRSEGMKKEEGETEKKTQRRGKKNKTQKTKKTQKQSKEEKKPTQKQRQKKPRKPQKRNRAEIQSEKAQIHREKEKGRAGNDEPGKEKGLKRQHGE